MSKRRRFFLAYLTTALLASVIVFFGAPLVRGSITNDRLEDMVRACRSDAPLSGVFMAMIGSRPTPASTTSKTPLPDKPPHTRRSIANQVPAVPGTDGGQSNAQSIPEPPVAANNTTLTATVYDYGTMWAVVTNDTAAVYDSNGNLAQELESGSIIEVAAVRTNQSERLAICRYDTKSKDMAMALIRARDLAIRKGSLDTANADLVGLLRKQAQLEMEIRAKRASLVSDLSKQNPHTENYSRARAACIAFNDRAKTLRAKADGAQGSARVEVMDKLRTMKEEESMLRREYEAARRAFDNWNESHTNVVKDTEPINALQQDLADVRKQILRFDAQ